jgi:hypothetical protein
MALNNHDQAQIRQYLLGKLSEAEQEKIEERLMVDDELFDEFEASKDELVEEYCAGDLGRAERDWFENHYLASTEGRQRQAFTMTMDHYLRRQAADPAPRPVSPVQPPTFFERFATFVRTQPWAVATATAMVLVVAVAFIWSRNSQGQIYEATLRFTSLKRGGDEVPPPTKIQLPPNTGQVKFHLQLPKPAAAGTTYTATLSDQVNTNNVTVESIEPDSVTVSIPRRQLSRAWYMLDLTATTPNRNVQTFSYSFIVE